MVDRRLRKIGCCWFLVIVGGCATKMDAEEAVRKEIEIMKRKTIVPLVSLYILMAPFVKLTFESSLMTIG